MCQGSLKRSLLKKLRIFACGEIAQKRPEKMNKQDFKQAQRLRMMFRRAIIPRICSYFLLGSCSCLILLMWHIAFLFYIDLQYQCSDGMPVQCAADHTFLVFGFSFWDSFHPITFPYFVCQKHKVSEREQAHLLNNVKLV